MTIDVRVEEEEERVPEEEFFVYNNSTPSLPLQKNRSSSLCIRKMENISVINDNCSVNPLDIPKTMNIYIARCQDGSNKSKIDGNIDLSILCIGSKIQIRGKVVKALEVVGHNSSPTAHETKPCDDSIILAEEIVLIQCAPDSTMVNQMLSKVLDDDTDYPASILLSSITELQEIYQSNNKAKRTGITDIVNRLRRDQTNENNVVIKQGPRRRLPHVKRKDIRNLEEVESFSGQAGWKICQPCLKIYDENVHNSEKHMNIPDGTINIKSTHGFLTRGEYIEKKKSKQVSWFISRLKQLPKHKQPKHILDVGGGRGDLVVSICQAFPDMRATVVDKNERSLVAGQKYASSNGVLDRIHFWLGDFTDFCIEQEETKVDVERFPHPIDFVVALHACGDLSDLAIHFAVKNKLEFLICPCCYTKRYLAPKFVPSWYQACIMKASSEQNTQINDIERRVDSLTRLAELNERSDLSRRAILVINSMRVAVCKDMKIELEEYCAESSKRNVVLVGSYLFK